MHTRVPGTPGGLKDGPTRLCEPPSPNASLRCWTAHVVHVWLCSQHNCDFGHLGREEIGQLLKQLTLGRRRLETNSAGAHSASDKT